MQAFIILLVITFSFFSVKSSNLNIIRDAETENFLKEISYILIKDNNLELNNLNFFIDNKDFINAFVIPGQKIFLTKGKGMSKERLTSFELALREAGIASLNLITVSSILPPKCEFISQKEGTELLSPGQVVPVV